MRLERSFACLCLCLAVSLPAFSRPAAEGIKNFHQIDNHVYRGGQPNNAGFQYLAKIGVKTIVDLREPGDRSSWEKQTVEALGMKYVNVPMTGLTPPTEKETNQILDLMEDSTSGPVFVHCMRGADRTGAVIGAYRVDHDHWTNSQALKEAKAGGIAFFQFPRKNYIRDFRPRTLTANASKNADTKPATAIATPAVVIPAVAH